MSRRESSATERALEMVRDGATAYKAAKATGVHISTVTRALKRRAAQNGH